MLVSNENSHSGGFAYYLNLTSNSKFNPIQTGGGGRILPARTLDVYDFFNKPTKGTKLGEVS